MLSVALPKKIEYQPGTEPNQGRITIEPCSPGYGITIGNSLRRVLLSSLPGAAVVGVKIKGVSHEFMTLPHLKEDILELILNLKQLRIKMFTDEIVKLELEVHGKKDVKGSDIKKNSAVEIVNPDMVIGHIMDMAGSLTADIYVSRGQGYEMIENREKTDKEVDYIEMDSIFSPIAAVGVKVEYVRVGKVTNFDKLIIDIKTDGTLSPQEAFEQSVKILIDQFNALLNKPADEPAAIPVENEISTDLSEPAVMPTEPEPEISEEKKEKKRPSEKRIDAALQMPHIRIYLITIDTARLKYYET